MGLKGRRTTALAALLAGTLAGCGPGPAKGPDPSAVAPAAGATAGTATATGYEPFAGRTGPGPRFDGYERSAHYVPMPDGVRLAVTVYVPTGSPNVGADAGAVAGPEAGPDASRFPVLLWYMPGHRESINPATGEIVSAYSADDLDFFTAHGYALAAAEMRGSGASFGVREIDRGPQIGRDGKALVDWLARQKWSDGTVGMVGLSYQGFSQYATAAQKPAALKAIFPEIAGFDDYTSMFYPGGILVRSLSEFATDSIRRDDQNYFEPDGRRPRLPSVPVVDEDGDGELADEIPIDRDGDGTFLNDGDPTYRDGERREHIYYRATKEHVANTALSLEKLEAAPYRDSTLGDTVGDTVGETGLSYADIDPADKPLRIAEAGIATYHRGGWFDYHARDTVMWHATLAGHAPSRLMMAPTAHGGFPADDAEALYFAGPYFAYFGDTATRSSLNREKLRFFDHHVRGLDNGFDAEPPVLLFVMGEGWRAEHEWPLARQQMSRWYLAGDGALSPAQGEAGVDDYPLDLGADSRTDGANRWNYRLASSQSVMVAGDTNGKRASYTTPALEHDMEVTGHPVVTLRLSSNLPAGDVFVYLEDVRPDGVAMIVTEGQLRANFAALHPIGEMVTYAGEEPAVAPELPWHRFHAADDDAAPFAEGRAVDLVVDLMPTAWVFAAGHRLRVSITGADAPSFALHPAYAGTDAPVYRVHTGETSWIDLPQIPLIPQ